MIGSTERKAQGRYRYPLTGLVLLFLLVIGGSLGFMAWEGFDFFSALYMTVITISTVGFGEVQTLGPAGRILVLVIIACGLGLATYTFGAIGNIILDGRFREMLGRRQMKKELSGIRDHYIVCGYGRMGQIVCEELALENRPFVVITSDEQEVETLLEAGVLAVHGDATDDEVLLSAGLLSARSLVAVVSDDVSNLYITLSARELKPEIYILARATDEKASKKLRHAGANRAISPYRIGGQRLVQALLRPNVYDYMEIITSNRGLDLLVEEIHVRENCSLLGQKISETNLRQHYDLIIIGLMSEDGEQVFNPGPEQMISRGDTLIMLGSHDQLSRLQDGLYT